MTAHEIELFYSADFKGRFPYDDCRRLKAALPIPKHELIANLDTYFADIAGFSSCATRLHLRPIENLKRGKRRLSKDFFEKHPSYEPIREFITPDSTPHPMSACKQSNA